MKYWLLTTEFPPRFGGGIGTYCDQWTRLLQQNGDEITIFLPDTSAQGLQVTSRDGIRIIGFSPFLSNTSGYLGYETMLSLSFSEAVRQMAEKEGLPDWIEAQEYQGIAYFLLQKKHLGYELFRDMKVVITCHCPSFLTFRHNHVNIYKLPYFWIGEMEKFSVVAADICISPSRYLANILKKENGLDKEFNILPNPYASPGKRQVQELEEKAVFVAKLSPAKGVLYTLQCFERLWDEGYSIRLKLVGDPNYFYHALQEMVGDVINRKYRKYIDAGLLQLTGMLEPARVKEEVRTSKVVLVPSTIENFPYTVIEAMAEGKLVLASTLGGQVEIITDGRNGFLFDYNNPDSFIDKIKGIFSLGAEKIAEMSAAAAETVAQVCDPQDYYRKKMELLESYSPSRPTEFPFVRKIPRKGAPPTDAGIKDLLSVVVPYYNMGRMIYDTLGSIQASSYPHKEIIVLNDGSSDPESLQVLEDLRKRTDLRVVDQRNQGLPMARNAGARQASGEFLCFLDADDLVDREYYSRAIGLMKERTNLFFAGCWVRYFGNSAAIWPAFNPEPPYILYHNTVNSSGLVYRRSAFMDAGLNDPRFLFGMEDYDSVISLVKSGYAGVVFPDTLFHYRVRKDSMARGFNKENKSYLYQLLAEKHREFYANFATEITSLLNANGPGFDMDNPTLDYHLYAGRSVYSKVMRRVISLVKRQPQLRKFALTLKRKLKLP